jgi:hypothetical protein
MYQIASMPAQELGQAIMFKQLAAGGTAAGGLTGAALFVKACRSFRFWERKSQVQVNKTRQDAHLP